MTAATEKGRRTRRRIIEATGEQILAAGIGGTTLDTVRAATLTSKSQLFHYFPGGKTELVREVAAWEGEQLLAAQEPEIRDLGSWGSWRRWQAGLVHYYFERGRWACPIGSLATEAAAADPATAALVTASWHGWQDLLAAGVARMRDGGELARGTDAEAVAGSLGALIQGGLVLSQLDRSPHPLRHAVDHLLAPLHEHAADR